MWETNSLKVSNCIGPFFWLTSSLDPFRLFLLSILMSALIENVLSNPVDTITVHDCLKFHPVIEDYWLVSINSVVSQHLLKNPAPDPPSRDKFVIVLKITATTMGLSDHRAWRIHSYFFLSGPRKLKEEASCWDV